MIGNPKILQTAVSNQVQIDDDNLDMSNLKEYADEKLCVSKIIIVFTSDRGENTVGKGDNAGKQHFLLFLPIVFKGLLFFEC